MKNNKTISLSEFCTLQKRVEEVLNKASSTDQKVPLKDVKNLVEDLQLHHVELEMQDQELRQVKLDLQESRDRLSRLYDFSPVSEISKRKEVEKKIERGKKQWEATFDAISDWVCLIDLEHRIQRTNRSAEKILGVPLTEIVGQKCCRLIHCSETPIPDCPFKKMLSTHCRATTEIYLPEKDCWFMVSVDPVWNEKSIVSAVHIVRNITEIKRMEEERIKSKKFESISVLAGGIAHKFNNALTPIIGNADLLKLQYSDNENTLKRLKDMKASGLHMAHITDQLVAYARGGKYNLQALSLSDFVKTILPLIQQTLDPDVRLETDLPPEVMDVEADGDQIEMVLSAVLANSNEAIEGAGSISVTARNIDLDHEFIKDHPHLKPGPYVYLSIEDDGKGMDRETRERIFEPFYTTHFMGRGLGMASVYGIIRGHDGAIAVESEPGRGTAIRIYLPAIAAEKEVSEKVAERSQNELPKGKETILIIEDEQEIMELTRYALTSLGYRVLEAETARKSIEIAKTFDGRIDLALLEIKLSDMLGDEVYPLIMEARPDLKVIVFSGYNIDGPVQRILDAGAEGFIKKPFPISILAGEVRKILEGKP